jgi:endothelin-converting enzyme/putative endopeptidase
MDFYVYACGGWRATHPIPPDKSRISRYNEMVDRNEAWTRELLENAANESLVRTPLERQVGDDYASCLDEAAIDARGQGPLREEVEGIDRALATGDWTELFARLHAQDVPSPFSIYALEDIYSPDRMLLQIDVGGMGLGSPGDYLLDDDHSNALRAAYVLYLQRLLGLTGERTSTAEALASKVLAMETSLARAAPDPLTRRSRELLYHPMTIQQIEEQAPSIHWRAYFQKLGAPVDSLRINVTAPAFMIAVESLIHSADRSAWRAFLVAHLIHRSIETLPASLVLAHFDFYGKTVRGLREAPPRWKRCVRLVNEHLGEAVGQLFVREHFSPLARGRVLEVVQAVRSALHARIGESSWMSEPTRREALLKVDAITVKIGHPDRWRDYSGLTIVRADAYGNARRARQFEMSRQISKLNRPTDRSEWASLPQDLDGYSTKVLNEIAFTAGILQRPFFDPSADAPLQFGALGAVVGHELIHLFDDQGRKFDAHGALRDWWTPKDAQRYGELAQCFVDEYGRELGLDDLHVNGRLTLGENLADNGGLRLAHRALKPDPSGPTIEGFTPLQRFFLAWAQIRCENTTDAALRQQLQSDGHSPGRQRVNVVVSNMTEFASAFGCPPKAPMAPEDRCVLW